MAKFKNEKSSYKMWKKSFTCSGKGGWNLHDSAKVPCGNLVNVDERDIKKCGNSHYGFVCPFCHCITEIPEFQIPQKIKDQAIKL